MRRPGIPALDGIRAVAVALVLADHGGIPGMAGGFLGVDVFFVLSGFLITSLLLDELGRSGRIDLANFWIRRARRLLPALVLMVLAVAIGRQFFSPEAIVGLRDDAVAAFFWVANWMFVADKTGYFAQGAPPSPLQHAWSLGVEEQYYIVWPLVLVAVAVMLAARARRQGKRATLGAVRLTVFLLSHARSAGICRGRHPARLRPNPGPGLLRYRYPGPGAASGRRGLGAAGGRLVIAESRMVADPLPVGQVDRQGAPGDRPGALGCGRSLRHR